METARTIKVCFVRQNAYPMFVPEHASIFGGADLRTAVFARALARRENFDVSIVVHAELGVRQCVIDQVRLIPGPPRETRSAKNLRVTAEHFRRVPHFPWVLPVRFVPSLLWRLFWAVPTYLVWKYHQRHPPRARFRRTFARIDAQVFCCIGMSDFNTDAAETSRRLGRKTLLMIASDDNLSTSYLPDFKRPSLAGESVVACHQMIMNASQIMVQTAHQQQLLKERFGRESILVYNPIDLGSRTQEVYPGLPERFVLWIGRSDHDTKRPALCMDLARLTPQVAYVMVMNPADLKLHQSLMESCPANVTIIERVAHDKIESLFNAADLFLSTSRFEGFPNSFLQAAKYHVPVISMVVDPNQMLSVHHAGGVAESDMQKLVELINHFWTDQQAARKAGQNAYDYARKFHTLEAQVDTLAACLSQLCSHQSATTHRP